MRVPLGGGLKKSHRPVSQAGRQEGKRPHRQEGRQTGKQAGKQVDIQAGSKAGKQQAAMHKDTMYSSLLSILEK